jgi:hypothetical protein
MDIKYTILPITEIKIVDFNQLLENSSHTLRYNNDETKFIIKWKNDTPKFLPENTKVYSQKEMLEILEDSEWKEIPIISGTTEQ